MKQGLKYCLLGFMCLLFGTAAMSAPSFSKNVEKISNISYIISQEEATHNAVCFLYYIYVNTPREAVSIDNQAMSMKVMIRLLSGTYYHEDGENSMFSFNKSVYAYLHPDPVGYYVYALKKIVI